jgi:Abi-like protein
MKFPEIEKHLSTPRLNKYLRICGSKMRAIKLYKANMKLSQAFHPLLGLIEVVLRNNINDALSAHFSDSDWVINQKNGFMDSPTLRGTRFYLKTEIERTERKLRQRQIVVTSGRIIAEQTFGFWTDLFEPHHFRLIGASPMNAFGNLPTSTNRSVVVAKLKAIRKFRNRINHNEPIILYRNSIDFTLSTEIHNSILEVLSWIDPKLVQWVSELDKVPKTLAQCQKI